MSGVLFNSSRPLGRCENVTAVWDAYDGPKRFGQVGFGDVSRFPQRVVVTDEFVRSKRHDQTIVMVEHGITGGKLYGVAQPHGVYTSETCGLTDYYVVTSEQTREIGAASAGIPVGRVLPLGLPRTDAYHGKRRGDGGTFLAGFVRAYLYVPTFRASWEPPAPEIDWAALDAQMGDDEILVVKRHMATGRPMLGGSYAHVFEVDCSEPSTPYLIDCDVVVTDYSSILFDGYMLGKPSVLMAEPADVAAYMEARGMSYTFPSEYGHVVCRSTDAMVLSARTAALDGMGRVECACLQRTASACDGRATERVVELVRRLL